MEQHKHVTPDDIDNLYRQMKGSENSLFRLSTYIYLLILIVFISGFWYMLNRLDQRLEAQLENNNRLVAKLTALEAEMVTIRNSLYQKAKVSPEEVQGRQVAQTIAKEANLRPASDMERQQAKAFVKTSKERGTANNLVILVEASNLFRDKKYQLALEKVDSAIALEQNLPVAYSLKASILKNMGDVDDAITNQTLAINIEKKEPFSSLLPNFYNTRGFWYLELEQLEKAKQDFISGSQVAIGDEKSFITENIVMVELFQENWQAAFDDTTELLALNVDGGWLSFFRAVAADKINNQAAVKKSLAKWHLIDNPESSKRLTEAIKGTAIANYTKWVK